MFYTVNELKINLVKNSNAEYQDFYINGEFAFSGTLGYFEDRNGCFISSITDYVLEINKRRFRRHMVKKGYDVNYATWLFFNEYWPSVADKIVIPCPKIVA